MSTRHDEFRLRDGAWEVDFDSPPESQGRKTPKVHYPPEIIPAERYYEPAEMEREWKGLWTHVWTIAGRMSDVANVGDCFTYQLGRENFIIVRSSNTKIRAFYNVCAHRGNKMLYNEFGSLKKFTCAFHSWEYDLQGKLTRVTDEELWPKELICDRPGLVEVACDTWGGFVFVNMDRNSVSLQEFLGPIPAQLAPYHLEDFVIYKDIEQLWEANWKTGVDAFIEAYHTHVVHPELLEFHEEKKVQYDCLPNGHSRMILAFGIISSRLTETYKSLPDILKATIAQYGGDPEAYRGAPDNMRAELVRLKRAWGKRNNLDFSGLTDHQVKDLWSYYLFPCATINITPDSCLVQRWRPHPKDPEKLIYDVVTLLPPVSGGDAQMTDLSALGAEGGQVGKRESGRPARLHSKDGMDLGYVLNQDYQQVPRQQEGLRSKAFKGMRFGHEEVRIRHYLSELDRYLEKNR